MSDNLVFNGINCLTGDYLVRAANVAQVADWATGTAIPSEVRQELDARQLVDFPVKHGVDANDLAESGWAVVFPAVADGTPEADRQAAIKDALAPLLDHRRAMATRRHEHLYRELGGREGMQPGESKRAFLARVGAAVSGPVDPDRFPYYVLLVASPAEISYRVQYQLDVQYGVGRLHFDAVAAYGRYARAVVAAETELSPRTPTAAFFAVENVDDPATYASTHLLTEPLIAGVRDQLERGSRWQVQEFLSDAASKARLSRLLGPDAPSLLFTASHGVGFPRGSAEQRDQQGAILCQDWPGRGNGRLRDEHYFAGRDIGPDADLRGLIAFHFACYGLGTPRYDDFAERAAVADAPPEIAPAPLVAGLPRAMLGRERGALACIGHIDRAWSSSFIQAAPAGRTGVDNHVTTFQSTIGRLMAGDRVGLAMDDFNLRYAELASELATTLENIQKYDERVEPRDLARLWLYTGDARNYAVLGDPAVRIVTDAAQLVDIHLDASRSVAHIGQFGACDAVGGRGVGDGASPTARAEQSSEALDFPLPDPANRDHVSALARAGDRIAGTLERFATDALAVEVRTFVGQPEAARAALTQGNQSQPRAYTRFSGDGDMIVDIPVDERGQVDAKVWRIHQESVDMALNHRRRLVHMALSLIPGTSVRKDT